MKYIYDIILNFDEAYYDFYEWNEEDEIEYIKKIPVIKISIKDFKIIKNNRFSVDNIFLESIKNMCEVYTDNNTRKIEYACLFACESEIIAILFNQKGISILKSDLIIDEALDIIDYCKKIKESNINLNIISLKKNILCTRNEQLMIDYMNEEIDNIYKNNIDKLKYIYYECFNTIKSNKIKMYNELKEYINTAPLILYNLLKLKEKNNIN